MENSIKIEDYQDNIAKAEKCIKYTFTDKELLLKALTHPSAVQGSSTLDSYERLEFLGDSLLGSYVAQMAYEKFPDLKEGKLTLIKIALVSGESLSNLSSSIGLSDCIIFGVSEISTGSRGLKSALENVFEAIVAAIYLDGGYTSMKNFLDWTVISKMHASLLKINENPKSLLQEKLQVFGHCPKYEIVDEYGPAHDKYFVAEVSSEDNVLATGTGKTKKEAESNAASFALDKLEEQKNN